MCGVCSINWDSCACLFSVIIDCIQELKYFVLKGSNGSFPPFRRLRKMAADWHVNGIWRSTIWQPEERILRNRDLLWGEVGASCRWSRQAVGNIFYLSTHLHFCAPKPRKCPLPPSNTNRMPELAVRLMYFRTNLYSSITRLHHAHTCCNIFYLSTHVNVCASKIA